ncbi:amidohydrolase [Arthrobacter humicola]|uniref:Amidohydrolase n=1 Tax=Arthrobacter humicola TaxID=409291 RepID=A0ABP5LDD9_9MICC
MPNNLKSADTVIVNARVHTLDARQPSVSTIAIANGRILASGGNHLLGEHRGPRTRVHDAKGQTITPGLIDGHIHPIQGSEITVGVDFGPVSTFAGFLAVLRTEALRVLSEDSKGWVRGWNLDYGVFEGRRISADLIEESVYGLPTYILLFDLHTALASKEALGLSGITGGRRFCDNSEIVVDDAGNPTGELREATAYDLVGAVAPALSAAQAVERARELISCLSRTGITSGTIMDGDLASLDFIDEIDSTGSGLPVRLVSALEHRPGLTAEEARPYVLSRDRRGRRWRGGLVKLFLDGVIDTGTGWLYEPDTLGGGLRSFWPDPAEYAATVKQYGDAGFQIATHAIGDRAIGAAIDAYVSAGVRSRRGAPHRIEHLECLADRDLARLSTAGITASMQPLHMQWRKPDGSDSWSSRLGTERSKRAWRIRDVIDSGAPVALGSDWPVAQYDARIGMAWARLRRIPGQTDAPVFESSQRLTALEALKGFSVWAAEAQGDYDQGTIRPGNKADLAIWADDPLLVSADDLIDLPIESTWVDGESVFSRQE